MPKPHSTFTISPVARYLLKIAAEQDGETRTRYLEQLIRADARRRKIPLPTKEELASGGEAKAPLAPPATRKRKRSAH